MRGLEEKKNSVRCLFSKISQTNFFCLGSLWKNSVVTHSVWRVCVASVPRLAGLKVYFHVEVLWVQYTAYTLLI